MPRQRLVIPIVAAVTGVIAWLIWRHSFVKVYDSLVVPLGTFVLVLVVGQVVMGMVQGMREAGKSQRKK